MGPFIAAGPIIAALSGGAIGAGVGGLTGALVGLGFPEYEAKRYEGKVKEGGVLISVHSESNDETNSAKDIFKEEGAHDISSTGETHTDVKDQADASTTASRVNELSSTQDIAAARVTPTIKNAPFVTIEQIQRRAYFIAERRKSLGGEGDENADWAQAEQELRVEGIGK